jgi:membrane-bound serine protease (ClpP class)
MMLSSRRLAAARGLLAILCIGLGLIGVYSAQGAALGQDDTDQQASLVATQQSAGVIVVAALDDAIHPITAEFILGSLEIAQERNANLYLLQLSTPGGLEESMNDIMEAFLASPVPTCVYVAPSGGRAASAGFMIALTADLVAMAPGTSMGSAHPVAIGAQELDETMSQKITNDAVARTRSIAERRGRPPELAVEAVSDSRSFAASEAVELGLADVMADSVEDLIAELDGRIVREEIGDPVALSLADAEVVTVEMSMRQRFLSTLAHPQIAYLLLLAGLAGLYFELSNPGVVLPGVIGAICLVMGLLALQQLPINYAGIALIALALLFFVLEIKIMSYGLLTVAGLIAFVLGSLLLFPGPIPEMRLSVWFVLPTALAVVGLAALLTSMVVRVHRGQVQTGAMGLVAKEGRAMSDLGPGIDGRVFVHGELWVARSDVPIKAGAPIEVVEVDNGLVVQVRPSRGL